MKASDVLIIGAGFAGLGAAIRLREAGIRDVVILERAHEVGGTWRDNTYPGAACDVPSLLYSYSFAENPEWSRVYAGSAEILDYIRAMVARFDLSRAIRFGADVSGLVFDEPSGTWTATTRDGRSFTARTVVMAAGPLANASLPKMRGIETYEGKKIHSARWDHAYDFAGKRVAVIGTGASAVQIIPELVKTARSLKVFQRTPGWVLPRLDYARSEWSKSLFRRAPRAQTLAREAWFWGHEAMALGVVWTSPLTRVVEGVAAEHLRRQVKDPWMQRQLTPDFRAGCKRLLMSNDYYPALQRPNAKLVTWPIATLSRDGIRTSDGVEHAVDCIVFATGFDVGLKSGAPFPIVGLRGAELSAAWAGGAKAYKSVSVAGFPNLFFTFGPNSGPGHNSALVYMESQIRYLVEAIGVVLDRDLRVFDVKRDTQERFHADIQRRLRATTWSSGCKSWYLTDDGYNGAMYPGFATQFARMLARVELRDYECRTFEEARPTLASGAIA